MRQACQKMLQEQLGEYSNLEADFTAAALVVLAGKHDITPILTVNQRDFSIYCLPKGRQFQRVIPIVSIHPGWRLTCADWSAKP